MSKKLFITGGSGDLGRVLCRQAETVGYSVSAGYRMHPERLTAGEPVCLDLTDGAAVTSTLNALQPDAVIHTAIPAPGAPNLRREILSAAYHLSRWCGNRVPLICLSTDMIFDGTRPPYCETDAPSPLSVYGQAKAEMELMADTVVRTSLIYDFAPGNRQIDWMEDKIRRGEKVRLYGDELRSPIWAGNLAQALIELLDSPFRGVLHVAGPVAISREALGRRLLELRGYQPNDHIEAVSAASSGRPADLTLDVSKAQVLLKTPLLTVDEAYQIWQAGQ